MSKRKLRLIGSIDQGRHYEPRHIADTLSDSAQTLALHAEFTGRPATRIYANSDNVVKLRSDMQLKVAQAEHWIRDALEKERALAVHHPRKTWFIIYNEVEGEEDAIQPAIIGNVTPRMRPLHIILNSAPETEEQRAYNLEILSGVFNLCLTVAKQQQKKLDEGLSNFTTDAEGNLYYVDDEYYGWDNFISFSAMLGVYLRTFNWFDKPFIEGLTGELIRVLDETFNDINCRASIAHQLRSAFMPGGKKQELSNLMSELLMQRPQYLRDFNPPPRPRDLFKPDSVEPKQVSQFLAKHQTATATTAGDEEVEIADELAAEEHSATAAERPVAESPSTGEEESTFEALQSEEPQTIAAPQPAFEGERYVALLADVHANYPALEQVMAYLDQHNIREGIVLGDIVGYGPDPRECIERLRDTGFDIIKGNHDHAAALNNTETGFSRNAKAVIDWTVEVLSDEEREWLMYLPPILETDDWMAVHGAPIDPAFFYGYVYTMTYPENLDYLQKNKRSICLHGHSHMPGVYVRDHGGRDSNIIQPEIALKDYAHSLVCPGSVGQPRNGKPDAQFAIFDRLEQRLNFVTVPYDYEPVIERMKQQDFPSALWTRLPKGQ